MVKIIDSNTATVDTKDIGINYIDSDIDEFEVEYVIAEPFIKGRISGPPEDCYPDEGYCEVESVKFNGNLIELTLEQMTKLEGLITETVREQLEEDYEDDSFECNDFF